MRHLTIFLCFGVTGLFAQDKTLHVGFSLESPTITGGWVTFNAHWIYQPNTIGFFELKYGLGLYDYQGRGLAFPHHLSYNGRVGKKNHFLEIALAGSYITRWENGIHRDYYLIAPEFGFRSVSDKGLLFRVFAQYPVYSFEDGSDKPLQTWPLPSIAIGKVFRIRTR